MKTKIYLGILSLVLGLAVASCEDDDYAINTTPVLTESSVVTGSSDVTATTATLHATVAGLDGLATSSYTTGFYYGTSQDNLNESTTASYADGAFSAILSGLTNNSTLYYQAYVCLQSKVYYRGEVKSLVTTNAQVATVDATGVDHVQAILGGTVTDAPSDATCGIVITTLSADAETVRGGLVLENASLTSSYSITRAGLLPNTQYYYAAYLDLGSGVVYGDVKTFTTDEYDFDLDNDLVDLGLSVKWARFNIGATTETGLGGLFAFGDTSGCLPSIDPADYASADTYKTAKDLAYLATDGRATLPTADDFEELFSLCTKEWTEVDGVQGYKLTGPNGNSIFLPAAGSRVAHEVTDEGVMGYYLTGTVNPSNSEFAVNYQFNASTGTKATAAVYQAMSVRAVSTAKNVPFNRELLYTKWYLDNGQDGEQHVFEGPFTQWGVTDTWATVSNGQPNIEQSIHWEMGTNNGWIGYTYGVDYGYMEFLEDGTVNIHRLTDDGTATDETGTYTIDEENKVIDIDINVLCANTWISTKSGKLNILSMTSDGLQIALPADDTYAYSLNYYSQRKADADAKIPVSLLCVGSDWAGTWGTIVDNITPATLDGQHTFTYEGACNGAMVFTLDFQTLMSKYPNAFVRIDDIKCDGTSIPFDANHFFYGDIENNGNYRIELFNIWGKGSSNGSVVNSPFSNSQNVGSDPAFNFSSTLQITYTISTQFTGSFTPNVVTINPSWGGTWGYNQGATLEIALVENQYTITNPSFDITYVPSTDADHSAGSIMTFIEVGDLFGFFPGTHATLDNLYLDGTEVTGFDATKVVDTSEGAKYRLELWNCYGATKTSGCAFGTPDGDVIKELAFSSSMQVKFTFQSLFAVPEW
ncbi:MAG: hypothetical protein Q4D56_08075 [Bacteroides sp.]|nr:hypothetical protein [Bacteroides sp.]